MKNKRGIEEKERIPTFIAQAYMFEQTPQTLATAPQQHQSTFIFYCAKTKIN